MIERPRERHDAAQAYATVRRLQARDAAERRWDADRSAGVRSRRERAHARGDPDRATTARAARDARPIPGILRGAEMRILIRDAEGPLVEVGLADDGSAAGPQP